MASLSPALWTVLLVSWGLGCGEPDPGTMRTAQDSPESPRRIRLAGELDRAIKESPLNDIDPVASWDAFAMPIAGEEVMREDFEGKAPHRVRASAGMRIGPRPRGASKGRALFLRGAQAVIPIPVEAGGVYRISFELFNVAPPTQVQLVEMATSGRKNSDGQRSLTSATRLTVHRLDPERFRTAGSWRTVEHTLSVGPWTNLLSFQVLLGKGQKGWFDTFRVERLDPSPAQRWAVLKTEALAETERPERGIVKYGRLLPIDHLPRTGSKVQERHVGNFEYRTALFAPPPTTFLFEVNVPQNAQLRVSCGLWERARLGEEARFRITVRPDDAPETELLDTSLVVKKDLADWSWDERTVDLSEYGGQRVTLGLRTEGGTGPGAPALWGNPVIQTPRREGDPPNVLLILVDTLRADRLSCYGYGRKTSPHIDALAEDGTVFESAISSGNWTPTSVASLFTGMWPSRHGVDEWGTRLLPGLTTMAELFRESGWQTHGIMWKDALYDRGFEQGFDSFFSVPGTVHDRQADNNLVRALSWLGEHRDRPFFLFLHFDDPHQSFNQPPPFDRMFNDIEDLRRLGVRLPIHINNDASVMTDTGACEGGIVDGAFTEEFRSLAGNLYDGEIAYVDDRIGSLVSYLRDVDVYDDTIIAFVSDHGETLWEHDEWYGHAGPYFYDELVRVPLILKLDKKGGVTTGRRISSQVRLQDLMPTLLEAAGVEIPDLAGHSESLLSMITGREANHRLAVMELPGNGNLALRDASWKYMLIETEGKDRYREMLFNLESDPEENTNLVGEPSKVLEAMRAKAIDFWLTHRRGRYVVATDEGLRVVLFARFNLNGRLRVLLRGEGENRREWAERAALASWKKYEPGGLLEFMKSSREKRKKSWFWEAAGTKATEQRVTGGAMRAETIRALEELGYTEKPVPENRIR